MAGRPRKIREQEPLNAEQPTEQEVKSPPVPAECTEPNLVTLFNKQIKFVQYTGKDDLPPAKYDAEGKCVKAGESRFFVNQVDKVTFKIMKIYRYGGKVNRIHWRTIRPQKNKVDRDIFIALKKGGITGLPKLFDKEY